MSAKPREPSCELREAWLQCQARDEAMNHHINIIDVCVQWGVSGFNVTLALQSSRVVRARDKLVIVIASFALYTLRRNARARTYEKQTMRGKSLHICCQPERASVRAVVYGVF